MTTLRFVALDLAKTGEAAKSGPIGFAVILVLCVVCYFLFKSMSKHLRKVREDFPVDEQVGAHPPVATDGNADRAPDRTVDPVTDRAADEVEPPVDSAPPNER